MGRLRWSKPETEFLLKNKDMLGIEELAEKLKGNFGMDVMPVQVRKKIYNLIPKRQEARPKVNSICWDCIRACGEGRGCSWVDSCGNIPVEGWKIIVKPLKQAESIKRSQKRNEVQNNIVVVNCPLFLGEVKSKKKRGIS